MSFRLLVTTLLSALALWGCGSSDLSPSAADELDSQIGTVRQVTTAGDVEAAKAELSELRSLVGRLEKNGQIGLERAERILAAADDVQDQLNVLAQEDEARRSTDGDPDDDDSEDDDSEDDDSEDDDSEDDDSEDDDSEDDD